MITRLFHAWERRLAAITTDRVVRGFDWGIDWLKWDDTSIAEPGKAIDAWSAQVMRDTDRFFDTPPTDEYRLNDDLLSFPSVLTTPNPNNNTVYAKFHRAANRQSRAAVVVLPQWNAAPDGHMALCRWLARVGVHALRLSLPYHDRRMPPELNRADYIVSANIGRTLQVCRQAVLDARRAIHWLAREGYERIGVLGTSLGSCLAMLTAAHEPRVMAAALNHVAPYFADVVWEGLSTAHIRTGLDGSIELDQLRRLWMPISPEPYIERMRGKQIILVYARYDLSFPPRLSRQLIDGFERRGIPYDLFVLPCGHYSSGIMPFSWLDGYALVRFLQRTLC